MIFRAGSRGLDSDMNPVNLRSRRRNVLLDLKLQIQAGELLLSLLPLSEPPASRDEILPTGLWRCVYATGYTCSHPEHSSEDVAADDTALRESRLMPPFMKASGRKSRGLLFLRVHRPRRGNASVLTGYRGIGYPGSVRNCPRCTYSAMMAGRGSNGRLA